MKRPVLTPLSEEALEYLLNKVEKREALPQRVEDTYHNARELFEKFFRSKK